MTWRTVFTAGLAAVAMAAPSTAQDVVPAELTNDNIVVSYGTPDGRPDTLQWLRQNAILERLAQFLSPIALPRKLTITSGGPASKPSCPEDDPNMYFTPAGDELVVCYSYIEWWKGLVARESSIAGITPQDIVAGGFAGPILHEAGHALSWMHEVPVLGREEDSADQMAAILMLEFSPELAHAALKGFAYALVKLGSGLPDEAVIFFDEHGTPSQRFYNTLCIAYGKNPQQFKDIVDLAKVPAARLANCSLEYKQVMNAYVKTLRPHIDLAKVEKVRSVKWVKLGVPLN